MGVGQRTMKTRKRSTKTTGEVKEQMADTETKAKAVKPVMTALSLSDIPARTTPGKAKPFVDEFLASGAEAARVDNGTKGFATTLRRYAKESGAPINIKTVQGQTYVTRA